MGPADRSRPDACRHPSLRRRHHAVLRPPGWRSETAVPRAGETLSRQRPSLEQKKWDVWLGDRSPVFASQLWRIPRPDRSPFAGYDRPLGPRSAGASERKLERAAGLKLAQWLAFRAESRR